MKRIFDFITKANQILLFLAFTAAIAGISFIVYHESTSHYEPPHVPVAQTPDEAKKTTVEDVRFLGESRGIYVFGIVKPEVVERGQSGIRSISYLSGEDNDDPIVNIVFSKGSQKVKTLLENDGLVIENNLSGHYYSDTNFTPRLFMCVTEDTDGNHVLDKRDREDLYIVASDLSKSDIVVKGASSFSIISATHVVVKTRIGDAVRFLDVDMEGSTKKEVEWK